MTDLSHYLGAAFAAWTGLGLLCLRTVNVRSRFGWVPLARGERCVFAGGAALFCGLSLLFALQAAAASFALVLWVSLLGVLGLLMTLLLPLRPWRLATSLKLAGACAVAAAVLPLVFR